MRWCGKRNTHREVTGDGSGDGDVEVLSAVAGTEPGERLSRLEEVATALAEGGMGMLSDHERPGESEGNGT